MTKRWKLKTNSSNILLVLITLILVNAEWVKGENINFGHIGLIGGNNDENSSDQTHIYVGNDEIAEYFFGQLANNNRYILDGISKCLNCFQLLTCVKMLLLSRINEAVTLMKEPSVTENDVHLLNGLLVFKIKNDTNSSIPGDETDELSLDEEISAKMRRIFWKRSLLINLLPKLKVEIEPASRKHPDCICFNYTIRKELNSPVTSDTENEGRKRKGGMSKMMMMMVPQLIMLGLMPFTLASLKAMVMNAVMINMMALNGAIFMTIRNLVFGPRRGDNVKYVNYGYSKDRQTQSKKPVLIIHSPAAFVKQPPVHRKPFYGQYSQEHHPSENGGTSQYYQHRESIEGYEGSYAQQEKNHYRRLEEKAGKKDARGRVTGI